jgi:hypothetical protein
MQVVGSIALLRPFEGGLVRAQNRRKAVEAHAAMRPRRLAAADY